MNSHRWPELDALLQSALELPPEERPAHLEKVCGENAELLQELRELVAADEAASGFLGPADSSSSNSKNRVGEVIGSYRLLEEIGRGGMGAVYRAERADGAFDKEVALKVLRPGAVSDLWRKRFRAERHILGRLDHPHIATLLDGGNTEADEPYLVMELVEGRPVDQYCREENLDIEERVALLEKVCGAVAFAHQNLVVHRDLKPGNVLVTEEGEPRLLDFGIAKLLEPDLLDVTVEATRTHLRPMSPLYASPEQLSGGAITTATDVWALGVLAYETLTGARPYEAAPSLAEMERARRTAPLAPSRVESTAKLNRKLRGDLDTIVLKALRADPERRYGTAADLGADFRRYLTGLPVHARPDSWGYRLGKFVGRNRVPVGLGSASLALIFGLLISLVFQAEDLRAERDKARQTVDLLVEVLGEASARQNPGEEVTIKEAMELGEPVMRDKLKDQPELLGVVLGAIGTVYEEMSLYEEARPRLKESIELLNGQQASKDYYHSIETLAMVEARTYNFDKARDWYRLALKIAEGAGTEGRLDLASNLRWLGIIDFYSQNFEESNDNFNRVLDILRTVEKPNVESERFTLAEIEFHAHSYLSSALERAGHSEEARVHIEKALEVAMESFPDRSAEMAAAYNDVAVYYASVQDREKAIEYLKKSLQVMESAYRPGHVSVEIVRLNLGRYLRLEGYADEAIRHSRQSQAALSTIFGPEHPDVGRATLYLVQALDAGNEWSELIEVMATSEGEAVFKIVDDKVNAGWAILCLVRAHLSLGQLQEARDVSKRSYPPETRPDQNKALVVLARAEIADNLQETQVVKALVEEARLTWPGIPIPLRFEQLLSPEQ